MDSTDGEGGRTETTPKCVKIRKTRSRGQEAELKPRERGENRDEEESSYEIIGSKKRAEKRR